MATEAETVVRRWFHEVWCEGRVETIDELAAEDALTHGLEGMEPVHGQGALKAFHHRIRTAFPDMRITIHDMVSDGELVASRCLVTATHSGPGMAVAPTHRPVAITGMCFARVRNGRIVEAWNNFDFLSLYRQMGMQLTG